MRTGEASEAERRGGSGTSVGIGCSGSKTWVTGAGGSSPPTLNRFFTQVLLPSATKASGDGAAPTAESANAGVAPTVVEFAATFTVSRAGVCVRDCAGRGSADAVATLTTAGIGLPELSRAVFPGG